MLTVVDGRSTGQVTDGWVGGVDLIAPNLVRAGLTVVAIRQNDCRNSIYVRPTADHRMVK